MKNKYFENATKRLKENYSVDLINDVLLIRENRVTLYADTSDVNNIEMHVISGDLSCLGLPDKEFICLHEVLEFFDLNNKYGEVSGKEEFLKGITDQIFDFSKESNVTFPIISDKKRLWIRLNSLPIDTKKNLNVFFFTDVTEYVINEELMFEKTHKDSLTNLFNKYTLDYHYGERYKNDGFHVMYFDLDDFKIINDTDGHNVGNDFLIAFAKILIDHDEGKSLFYRVGGDEFVGLLFGNTDKIIDIAKSIIKETQEIKVQGSDSTLSTSIGVIKATKSEDLIRKADKLLYEAKQSGKNRFVYGVEE
jgi:diguanylate cyclase (GGDEF)-like protein